jgi:hypothetical protein
MARTRFQGWIDLRSFIIAAIAVAALPMLVAGAAAEGFRIETSIFANGEDEAVSTTTTLFLDGVFYDYLDDPQQIAVFRKPGGGKPGRFILLDPARRVRTELTTDQLAGAMDKLSKWAARQKDPFLKFAANPDFDEEFDADTGRLTLASYEANYTLETSPAGDPERLAEYREFLDWYARLNALMQAGPPPGPRLKVNAALTRHKLVPLKVELLRQGEKEPIRSEHNFTWRLSKLDFERIDDTNASLAAYREVANDEFLRGAQAIGSSK